MTPKGRPPPRKAPTDPVAALDNARWLGPCPSCGRTRSTRDPGRHSLMVVVVRVPGQEGTHVCLDCFDAMAARVAHLRGTGGAGEGAKHDDNG